MLAGDRAQLERYYTIDASGTRQAWTLRLSPRTGAARESARHRRCAARRRTALHRNAPVKGDVQRTLLASAARTRTPASTRRRSPRCARAQ
jgi:hypothetical protein